MVMTVTIDANQFQSYLDERISRISDAGMTVLLNGAVYQFLSERVSDRFESSGDSASGPWASVSPVTIHNRKSSTSTKPMIDTGALRSWAENPPGQAGATVAGIAILDYPSNPPGDEITNYKYLMAQFGINNTFGKTGARTPARPIFAVDSVDLTGIMLILFAHIME